MGISLPTKKSISLTFSRKAKHYQGPARIQKRAIQRLLTYMNDCGPQPHSIIADLGCGTGFLLQSLRSDMYEAPLLCLDLALASLRIIRQSYGSRAFAVQGDIEALPVKPFSVDGVVLASVLQWLHNPITALCEINRVLSERGFLAFSVFLSGTLSEIEELRASFGLSPSVRYYSREELTGILSQAGFALVHSETLDERLYYSNALEALRSINSIGATACAGKRLSRGELAAFCAEYERRFGNGKGVSMSYCVFLGIARKRDDRP